MNAKEFYEFQLNDRTSVVGRQDKDEIIMLMEEYYMYKVKTCNKPAVSESVEPVREGTVCEHVFKQIFVNRPRVCKRCGIEES